MQVRRVTVTKRPKRRRGDYTKVIFRKSRNPYTEEWEVEAFFPDGHVNPGNIMCYAHVGQHSEASIEYYAETKPCSPKEYADLKRELWRIGYRGLRVMKKVSRRDQEMAWWPERFKEDR